MAPSRATRNGPSVDDSTAPSLQFKLRRGRGWRGTHDTTSSTAPPEGSMAGAGPPRVTSFLLLLLVEAGFRVK